MWFFSLENEERIQFSHYIVFILKKIAKENRKNLNLIECTSQPFLLKKLEVLKENMNDCEKALHDYLEKKKILFPRFNS